jgi:hypothetical protein
MKNTCRQLWRLQAKKIMKNTIRQLSRNEEYKPTVMKMSACILHFVITVGLYSLFGINCLGLHSLFGHNCLGLYSLFRHNFLGLYSSSSLVFALKMPRQLLRNEEYKPTVMTKWIIQTDSYDEMKNTSQDSYYEMNNTSQDSYDEIKDTSRSRQLWRNEYKHTVITKWRIHGLYSSFRHNCLGLYSSFRHNCLLVFFISS